MLRAMATEYFDVIIVGAGLSGIGAAWHLQDKCPDRNYLILEERESMGGTWDLFRYPGIRSDSDMYTLGYNFKPWKEGKAIADGPSILKYIKEMVEQRGRLDDRNSECGQRRNGHDALRLPPDVRRLLQLQPGLPA